MEDNSFKSNKTLLALYLIHHSFIYIIENYCNSTNGAFHWRTRVGSVCKGAARFGFPPAKVGRVRTEP